MKTLLSALLLLLVWTSPALALDKAELDARINRLIAKLEALQGKPDKRIPAEKLQNAKGIILLDRTKAGFIFAYQGGSGVAMVKENKGNTWTPVAFYKANEASLGFQIGGQQSFVVILLMSTNATRLLTGSVVDFGGEASGTAGQESASVEGKVSPTEPSVILYGDRKGLYGGAAIKGGDISPDDDANRIYYGTSMTAQEILFGGKVKPTPRASELAKKITEAGKVSSK